MRPQSSMGIGEKCLQARKRMTKLRKNRLLKPGQRRRSMHMLTKRDLSSDEKDCLRRSRKPEAVGLQHRERRVCLHQIQVQNEVTIRLQETGARQTQKTRNKRTRMSRSIRTTICETLMNGWRSWRIIWRTQKSLCAHTCLKTQIRNVLRKWCQNQGSTVFILTSQKTEIVKYACGPKWQGPPCRRRTGEPVPRAEKFGDLISADHKVLNEEGESRNNHRTLSWCKILPLNGFYLIRAKQQLLRRRKRVCESSSSC